MAHRFNFTGRKRIFEDEAKIHVIKEATPLKIRLEQTFSSSSRYSPTDIVVIDAIRRTKLQRVSLGTIATLHHEIIIDFEEFHDGQEVYYRIYVTDPETHQVKGLAKRLKDADRDTTPIDIEPILPVALSQPDDGLGRRFWMVKCSDIELPILIISSEKFSNFEPVKSPEFKALVWPEVLRQVLTYAFVQKWNVFPNWADKWRRFVNENLGVLGGPQESPATPEDEYMMETSQWIDDAVQEFAKCFNLGNLTIKNLTKMENE